MAAESRFGESLIYIQFIAGMTGIAVAAVGAVLSVLLKYLFRARLKQHHRDIYRRMFPEGPIGWLGGKDIERLIYDTKDSTLVRLYNISRLAPIISLIAFAVSVIAFIVLSS